jgi:hypothetical protein
MAFDNCQSIGSHGTFGNAIVRAPRTYSISAACRAPTSRDVAGTPLTLLSGGTGIFRSNE